MKIRKTSTCWAISFAVTLIGSAAMGVFDVFNGASHAGHGHVPTGDTNLKSNDVLLHIAFTVALLMPASLFITFAIRRATILADELQRLVDRDRLTNLASREYFFTKMGAQPVSGVALMVDIDRFKVINDTYGHQIGDKVLRDVADILAENVRMESDIVCRFGGEEFVVFLAEHTIESGKEVAERLREAVAAHPFKVNGKDLKVTISLGGAPKSSDDDIEKVIPVADSALYQSKARGRNQSSFSDRVLTMPSGL